MLHYGSLLSQVDKGKVQFTYCFIGEEEYLKQQAVKLIAEAYLGKDSGTEPVRTIYASEVDGQGIVDQASNLGFFHQRQVLVVKEIEALSTKSRKAVRSYLEHPSPDTCLILSSFKLESKSPFIKDLEPAVAVVMFGELDETELLKWLAALAKQRGLTIDDQAAESLIYLSGTNLGVLDQELDKVAAYLSGGQRTKIQDSDVKALAGMSSQSTPTELVQAVARKDRQSAMSVLERLLNAGEDPVRLLSNIYYQMEPLWRVWLVANRRPGYVDNRTYWMSQKQELRELAQKRKPNEYLAAMEILFQAEHQMKTGTGEPRSVVQKVVHQLTS